MVLARCQMKATPYGANRRSRRNQSIIDLDSGSSDNLERLLLSFIPLSLSPIAKRDRADGYYYNVTHSGSSPSIRRQKPRLGLEAAFHLLAEDNKDLSGCDSGFNKVLQSLYP